MEAAKSRRSGHRPLKHRDIIMNDQLFGAFKGQSAQMLEPTRELSKLTIAKLEQLVSLQLASLQEYTNLNLEQLKAASDIAGPEDLQAYVAKQQDFLKTVGEKLAGDAHAIAALGKEFSEEAQKIAFKGAPISPKGFL